MRLTAFMWCSYNSVVHIVFVSSISPLSSRTTMSKPNRLLPVSICEVANNLTVRISSTGKLPEINRARLLFKLLIFARIVWKSGWLICFFVWFLFYFFVGNCVKKQKCLREWKYRNKNVYIYNLIELFWNLKKKLSWIRDDFGFTRWKHSTFY